MPYVETASETFIKTFMKITNIGWLRPANRSKSNKNYSRLPKE